MQHSSLFLICSCFFSYIQAMHTSLDIQDYVWNAKQTWPALLQKHAVLVAAGCVVCRCRECLCAEEILLRKWRIGWLHVQSTLHTLPLLVSTLSLSQTWIKWFLPYRTWGRGDWESVCIANNWLNMKFKSNFRHLDLFIWPSLQWNVFILKYIFLK